MKTQFGRYLTSLRIKSGAKSVTDYLKGANLDISETYYRALENGDKTPAAKAVANLVKALNANPVIAFRFFLEDLLPKEVFEVLVARVSGEPAASTKAALQRKDETIAAYRESLGRLSGTVLTDDIYLATDDMVDFLDKNFNLLPLVHFIYEKDSWVSEEELKRICELNDIRRNLSQILRLFKQHQIANIRESDGARGKEAYSARRFKREFRLPASEKGSNLRRRWILFEIERGLTKYERSAQIQTDKTFAYATIDCYQTDEQTTKIQNRILDTIAALNAARGEVSDPNALPYFVSIMVSPRPEYALERKRTESTAHARASGAGGSR